jgi:hypothetical protein
MAIAGAFVDVSSSGTHLGACMVIGQVVNPLLANKRSGDVAHFQPSLLM